MPGQSGSRVIVQRGDVGVDFLQREVVEPGRAGAFAVADEEDGDARQAVAAAE